MQQKAKSANAVLFELYSSKSKSELKTLIKFKFFCNAGMFEPLDSIFTKFAGVYEALRVAFRFSELRRLFFVHSQNELAVV